MNSNRSTAASTLYKAPCAACDDWRFFRRGGHSAAHFARCGRKVFLIAVIKTKSSATSNAAKSCFGGCMPRSHSAAFGVFMIAKPAGSEGGRVFRRVGPVIGTVAAVAFATLPTMAFAQVNIDQGKSAADIFSSVCTACHKTPRGLAAGKNSLILSAFLREHYTASSDQASALAAYVLGAGGAEPAPKQKPDVEHARAEEPKTGDPKTTSHPVRAAAKPEEEKRPKQEARREEHLPSPLSAEKHEPAAETASREVKPKPDDTAHAVAPVSAAPTPAPVDNASPSVAEPPKAEVTPTVSAAVPAEEQPNAGAAVPRDNIPD
jgi:hypothetical protein